MATRFYLPSTGTAACTPAVHSEWNSSWQVESHPTSPSKISSSMTDREGYETTNADPYDSVRLRYVSEALAAQTITGTIKGQLGVWQSADTVNACRAMVVKVVSNDGSTVRGTLLSEFPSSLTSEWATSRTNRNFPPSTAVTSVDAQDGDRIVIEIGSRRFGNPGFGYHRYRIGDVASSDLPEDETSTNDYNGWVEFSQTLDFLDEVQVGQVIGLVEYEEASPQIRVTHIGVQVEYTPVPPGQFTYTGNVTAIVSVTSDRQYEAVYDGNVNAIIGVEGTYSWNNGIEFVYTGNVTAIVSVSSDLIHDRVYVGSVYAYVSINGVYSSPDRVYTGNVNAIVSVNGRYSTPIPGWDKYTGYGLVELDDLTGPPPFWCVEEGEDNQLVVTVTPEENYDFYAEFDLQTTGGVEAGSATIITYVDPAAYEIETLGEVRAGGALLVTFVDPTVYQISTAGGVTAGGASAFSYVDPSDIPVFTKETRGGVVVEGALAITTVDPTEFVFLHTTSGEVKVGEVRRPPVEHWIPTAEESTVTLHLTSGGVMTGGSATPVLITPPTPLTQTTSGGVLVAGSSTVLVEVPLVIFLELMGGVCAGGLTETTFVDIEAGGGEGASTDLTTEVFETWALNGFNFEPSIYSGFPFNSYAEYGGQYLAAGPDGIYTLEGTTDNGLPIRPGVRIGPMNFNTTNRKRLRSIHMQDAGTPEVRVVGDTTGQEAFYTEDERHRISSCRTVQDEALTVEIVNFKSLSQIEITPVVLEKR